MANLKDAQRATGQLGTVVHWRIDILVLQRALARYAQAGSPQIAPACLLIALRLQGGIQQCRHLLMKFGLMVQVYHQKGILW
jgi:hypothetical protein